MSIHRSIALVLTLAVGVNACGTDDTESSSDDDESTVEVDDSTVAVDTTAEEPESKAEEVEESSEPEEAAPPDAEPAVFDADATELIAEFTALEPGTHRVTSLGTPFSFTAGDGWWVYPNEPAMFVLADPATAGYDDRDIVFMRAIGLSDPDAPNANKADQTGWPLDDIEGWLDNVADGIIITNRQNVTLGDRNAVRFDIRIDDAFECGTEFCVGFVPNGNNDGKVFNPGVDFRVHWIDEGDSPIVIVAGAGLVGEPFFERVDAVLSTLAFGDPQPHPIDQDRPLWEQGQPDDVPAGRADFPTAGVSFELSEERYVNQRGSLVGVIQRTNSGIYIFKPTSDLDGNPLATSGAVADAILADTTVGATEVDVSVESAYPIRQFTTAPDSPITFGLKWDDTPGLMWNKGSNTTLWIIDLPGGVVLVSAEGDSESTLEAAVAEATEIIPTLQTIPAG